MITMGFVHDLTGLVIARVFLGLMESGYFPGVAFYLTLWYRRSELSFRLAIFFAMASLAGAFGGIIAYCIGKMENVGGKHGWSWIFMYNTTFARLIKDSKGF
jgi:MFS family permease